MKLTSPVDLPVWTDDALHRLLGACDGYIHAIASIRMAIGRITYRPINPRHTRLLRQRERIVIPLEEIEQRLTKNLRECQEAYKRESGRAALGAQEKANSSGSEG